MASAQCAVRRALSLSSPVAVAAARCGLPRCPRRTCPPLRLARAFSSPASPGATRAHVVYLSELAGIEAAGTLKRERVIVSPQSAEIRVAVPGEAGRMETTLNFCANNYLGLSDNAELIAAAKAALDARGHGMSSVRFICGTQDMHRELERKLAEFHGVDDAILYASCFDANAGIFEVLCGPEDAIVSDELNHASIIDGIRLCRAQKFRFAHMDMADLEAKLRAADEARARVRLVVTDGAFSMDGDVAPLKEIRALADRYEALVMTDECHCAGFMGRTGRGSPEHCGVRVDIVNGTLGKALGGAIGGYTASSQPIVDLLRQRSRPYLFSNAVPPAVVGSAIRVMDLISENTALRDTLERNTRRFREGMTAAGFEIRGDPSHPIVPIMLYDASLATAFADDMLKEGVYVIGFSFPVVPRGQARIRVQLSAAHTPEHIDKAIAAFAKVGKAHGILKS